MKKFNLVYIFYLKYGRLEECAEKREKNPHPENREFYN